MKGKAADEFYSGTTVKAGFSEDCQTEYLHVTSSCGLKPGDWIREEASEEQAFPRPRQNHRSYHHLCCAPLVTSKSV